jgi:prepilin-type N-terminal cleavage/methylation domain-containing protein
MWNRQQHTDTDRGLTLIELIIALSLAATLIASVYYFWAFLNRHTYTHTQNAQLAVESHRIVNTLLMQLQRASTVLSFDIASIQFVASQGDTLRYSFDGDSLRINGTPLLINNKGAVVAEFKILDMNENDIREAQHTLIEITLSMYNHLKDTTTVIRSVRISKPLQNDSDW